MKLECVTINAQDLPPCVASEFNFPVWEKMLDAMNESAKRTIFKESCRIFGLESVISRRIESASSPCILMIDDGYVPNQHHEFWQDNKFECFIKFASVYDHINYIKAQIMSRSLLYSVVGKNEETQLQTTVNFRGIMDLNMAITDFLTVRCTVLNVVNVLHHPF